MYNKKIIFLYATLFIILLGISATYASDVSEDMQDSTDIVSNSIVENDIDTSVSNDVDIKEVEKDNSQEKIENDIVDKSIKKDSTFNVNNDNVGDYFDVEDDYLIPKSTDSNIIYQIEEDMNSQYVWLFEGEYSDITITTVDGVTLTNQAFEIYVDNFTFEGVSLEYTPEFAYEKAIHVANSGFKITGSNIDYDAEIVDVNLNCILLIEGEHSSIIDSTFTGNFITTEVDWNEFGSSDHSGFPTSLPILIRGNYSTVSGNTMTFIEKENSGVMFPSFYGLSIAASYVNVTNNDISLTGSNGYVYVVYLTSTGNRIDNNYIANNHIIGESQHNYTSGVYIEGSRYSNNTVINNTIAVTSGVDEKPDHNLQDVVYAVVITNRAYVGSFYRPGTGEVYDNKIINNTITAVGHQVYAFEQFGGDNTLISGNVIETTGVLAEGIGVIGYNTNVVNNTIIATGSSNQSEFSPDYIPPKTAGIQSLYGSDSTYVNNTIESTNGRAIAIMDKNNIITGNNITVNDYDYTIELQGNITGNNIYQNNLHSRLGDGSSTIKSVEGNDIGDNFDDYSINLTFEIDEVSGTIGDEIELFTYITNSEDDELNGQLIYFYANDELITSVELSSFAAYCDYEIPLSWYKQEIIVTAKFEGYELYNPAEISTIANIKIPTSINTSLDDATVLINSTDLKVNVVDIMDNAVDSNMNIYINDVLQEASSTFTFVPEEVGTYVLRFEFDEATLDDGYTYASSSKTVTVNVEPLPTNIEFNDITVSQNQLTTITAKVFADNSNMLLNEGIIEFTDADNNILATANVINSMATVELSFANLGENVVYASFKDSDNFATSTGSAVITVVSQAKRNTNVVINPINVVDGEQTTITAVVTDEYGEMVTNGKVVFKVNGKTIKDENGKIIYANVVDGIATVTYDFPSNLLKNTTYITATYSASSKYISSKSNDTYITVTDSQIILTAPTVTAQINENIEITVNVTKNNQPVNSGKVVAKINGKTLKDSNGKVIYAKVTNGKATFDYTIPDSFNLNEYTLNFVYTSQDIRIEENSTITIV